MFVKCWNCCTSHSKSKGCFKSGTLDEVGCVEKFQVPIHPEAGIPTDELSLEHGEPSFPFVASVSFRWLWHLRQRSNQDIHIKQLARHTVQHLQHLETGNVGHVVTKKHGFEVRFGAFRAYKVSRCRP